MTASKTDVYRELVHLLETCPTERLDAVACLLFHLLDDEGFDNYTLIDAITKN